MSFTEQEIAYLRSQPLARMATVAPDRQPDAVPLAFEFDRMQDVLTEQMNDERSHPNLRLPDNRLEVSLPDVSAMVPGVQAGKDAQLYR